MMRTQRSNYGRKTVLHFHPAVEGEGLDPFCLGMQMAVEPREAGASDKGQREGIISSQTNSPCRFKRVVLKMNPVMF